MTGRRRRLLLLSPSCISPWSRAVTGGRTVQGDRAPPFTKQVAPRPYGAQRPQSSGCWLLLRDQHTGTLGGIAAFGLFICEMKVLIKSAIFKICSRTPRSPKGTQVCPADGERKWSDKKAGLRGVKQNSPGPPSFMFKVKSDLKEGN